jgi:hypothetical protein
MLHNKIIFFWYYTGKKEGKILFFCLLLRYVTWSLATMEPCECRRRDPPLHQRNRKTQIKEHVYQNDGQVLCSKIICSVLNGSMLCPCCVTYNMNLAAVTQTTSTVNLWTFGQPYNTFPKIYCTDEKPFFHIVNNWQFPQADDILQSYLWLSMQ